MCALFQQIIDWQIYSRVDCYDFSGFDYGGTLKVNRLEVIRLNLLLGTNAGCQLLVELMERTRFREAANCPGTRRRSKISSLLGLKNLPCANILREYFDGCATERIAELRRRPGVQLQGKAAWGGRGLIPDSWIVI